MGEVARKASRHRKANKHCRSPESTVTNPEVIRPYSTVREVSTNLEADRKRTAIDPKPFRASSKRPQKPTALPVPSQHSTNRTPRPCPKHLCPTACSPIAHSTR